MTYNVHQLLHLQESVEELGPQWSHSCFFFEDLNGDFHDLFHGTQNIDGQVFLHTLNTPLAVLLGIIQPSNIKQLILTGIRAGIRCLQRSSKNSLLSFDSKGSL